MDENVKEVRTHRVGSITLGSALVLFGILFLVHLFVPVLTYEIIFHIWPCIFIPVSYTHLTLPTSDLV